jgi:hypothetical protein
MIFFITLLKTRRGKENRLKIHQKKSPGINSPRSPTSEFREDKREEGARNQPRILRPCQRHRDLCREVSQGDFCSSLFDIDLFFSHTIFTSRISRRGKIKRQQQKTGEKCQIINLGCGFDTLYWRLRDAGHLVQNFIELDFPTVTAKKCYQIKRNKVLLDKIHAEGEMAEGVMEERLTFGCFSDGEIRFSPTDLHATNYHIVGVDLRSIDEVSNKLKQSDVDFSVPTIFLGEFPWNSWNFLLISKNSLNNFPRIPFQPSAFWCTSRRSTATTSSNGSPQTSTPPLSSTTSKST